jgi:hypothetical protein
MAIRRRAVSEMSTLLTDLVWYWDLSSADATITDQHSGLSLSRVGTTITESTGGPDGGPCINFGAAAGKYRNASVAKTVSGNGRRYADLNIPIGVFPRRRRSRSGGGVL